MVSVVSGGTMERMVARREFNVLRAGSGTLARYLSTSFEVAVLLADELAGAEVRLRDFGFFMVDKIPLQAKTGTGRE